MRLKQLVRAAATIWPRPLQVDLWPFDFESGVRVACDVAYLFTNFSLPGSLSRTAAESKPNRGCNRRLTALETQAAHSLAVLRGSLSCVPPHPCNGQSPPAASYFHRQIPINFRFLLSINRPINQSIFTCICHEQMTDRKQQTWSPTADAGEWCYTLPSILQIHQHVNQVKLIFCGWLKCL